MYAKRFAGHEAYCFHSTAVIDHGCLRYGRLMQILVIVCISEALLKLEQTQSTQSGRGADPLYNKAHLGGRR